MLTSEDREEIKRLVVETIAEFVPLPTEEQRLASEALLGSDPVVDVAARAIEVFGTREKALHWLRTPVRSLGDQTPISLLTTPDGICRVQDTLGQVEHGVW